MNPWVSQSRRLKSPVSIVNISTWILNSQAICCHINKMNTFWNNEGCNQGPVWDSFNPADSTIVPFRSNVPTQLKFPKIHTVWSWPQQSTTFSSAETVCNISTTLDNGNKVAIKWVGISAQTLRFSNYVSVSVFRTRDRCWWLKSCIYPKQRYRMDIEQKRLTRWSASASQPWPTGAFWR